MRTVTKGIVKQSETNYYVSLRRNKILIHVGKFFSLEDAVDARNTFIQDNPATSQGNHMKEKAHIHWKVLRDYSSSALKNIRYCERCSKDLLNATHYEWCIHHKDYNRFNNVEENFELLCKSCHQKEHVVRDLNGQFA